jgi:hypothetical protein
MFEVRTGDFYQLITETEWEYTCRTGSKKNIVFEMIKASLAITLGTMKIVMSFIKNVEPKKPMHEGFITCTIMWLSGF